MGPICVPFAIAVAAERGVYPSARGHVVTSVFVSALWATRGGGVVYHKGYLPDGTFESGVVHTTSTGSDDPAHGSLTLLIGPSLQPFVSWIVPNTSAHPADLEFDAYIAAGRWDIARDVDDKVATGPPPRVAQSADTNTLVTTWPRAEGYTPRSAATAIANGTQIGPIYIGGDQAVGPDGLRIQD